MIEGENGVMDGGGRVLRVVVWLRRREGLEGVIEAVSRVEALLRYTVRRAFLMCRVERAYLATEGRLR